MIDYSNNKEYLERVKCILRDYQIAGVAQGIHRRGCLYDMYMGYGKTVTCLTALFGLRPKKILIICGRAALGTWLKEIKKWYPEYADPKYFNVIKAQGTATARKEKWSKEAVFYISTYQTFNLDSLAALENDFDAYVIDEVHKLPGHKTKGFKALEKNLRDIPIKFMLTGTWVKRHAGRGWRQLHLLNKKAYPSYWKFINRYCVVIDNGFGMEIVGPQNTKEFFHSIQPYVFRFHIKNKYVPDSVRKLMWIDKDKQQAKMYDELSKYMFTMLENGKLIVSSVSISAFTKHRQLLNCPKILDDSLGMGAAFDLMMTYLKTCNDEPEEQHFVLFSPFKLSIPHYEKALQEAGYKTWVFQGGVDGLEVFRRSESFRAAKGTKSVAICTIDFAESYDLGTSIRSHFLGLVWDNDVISQAEARLARADSDLSQIIVHKYWLYNDSIDEERISAINGQVRHVKELFKDMDDVKKALYGG